MKDSLLDGIQTFGYLVKPYLDNILLFFCNLPENENLSESPHLSLSFDLKDEGLKIEKDCISEIYN